MLTCSSVEAVQAHGCLVLSASLLSPGGGSARNPFGHKGHGLRRDSLLVALQVPQALWLKKG